MGCPDLITSTKDWVDLNGGDQSPGDTLRYTIAVIDSGGGEATGVTVTDDIPADVNSFNLVSIPTGAAYTWDAAGGAYGNGQLTVTGITVPAGGSVEVVFDIDINSGLANDTTIDNSVIATNPLGPDGTPSAPTVTVTDSFAPITGDKILYLYDDNSPSAYILSRTPTPTSETSSISINRGAARTWSMNPGAAAPITIDPAVNPTVPVNLILRRGNSGNDSGNRSITVNLQCSSGGAILTDTQTVYLNNNRTVITFDLDTATPPWTTPITCGTGDSWNLTINNNAVAGTITTDNMRVYAYQDGLTPPSSRISLPASTVINVNNIIFHTDSYANGGGSTVSSLAAGSQVWIQSTVSDPFGSYDINPSNTAATLPDITITDSSGTVVLPTTDMTELGALTDTPPGTKTFEYGPYTIPAAGPGGNWTVQVDAPEGTELSVIDSGKTTLPVIMPMPLLTIMKSVSTVSPGKASPGEIITYTVTVLNSGSGDAHQVILDDDMDGYTDWGVDTYGTDQPFRLIQLAPDSDGAGPLPADSGVILGTPIFYDANNTAITPIADPDGFDSSVERWVLPMSGVMLTGGRFQLQYDVKVK